MNINRSIINKEALNKILNNPLQRQFEQFRSETEPFHKPFQDGCNRLLDESNWITEVAHYLKERNEATPILFLKAGWPPPLDFPASQLDKLMDDFLNILENETRHIDKFIKEMSKVFIDFYDNERIDEIEDRWSKNPFLSNRMCILKEGLLNYREKRFQVVLQLFSLT
ncbi:hypothetical protein [Vreelandella lionensis]|uniref:hypothetical protein n=1 Tax=Vreelandella lionensis TaxID=1144478 RepID=UPI0009F5E566|nr:hypothetical protein [Halomonas lionensis]